MISSEVSKQFLLEEDAVEGFKIAVGNGQIRLALQILTEVVDGIMEIFDSAFSDEEEVEETAAPVQEIENKKVEEKPVVAEEKTEEVIQDSAPAKKAPAKKATESTVSE